jgi:hypothetical protein
MRKLIFLAILASVLIIMACNDDDIVYRPEEVSVLLSPDTTLSIYFGNTYTFNYSVYSTPDTTVTWYVNGIDGGNDSLGTVDSTGTFTAPSVALEFDSVLVKVVSQADTTKADSIGIIIRDNNYVYVDSAIGSDTGGHGTYFKRYRTITKGLQEAIQRQIVRVNDGTYYEDEVFPLIPRFEVSVQGTDTNKVFVMAPEDTSAFRIEYKRAVVRNLTILGDNYQGYGIEFGGSSDIDTIHVRDLVIEDCYAAFIKTGEAANLLLENCSVNDCVYGFQINQAGTSLRMNSINFANIDSIAVNSINPIGELDFLSSTINNAWIGIKTIEGEFCLINGSTFSNIDSIAVLLYNNADLESGTTGNDFSGCDTWCVYNASPDTIAATGNTWPSTDPTTIDTQYIYDDDENDAYGPVIFQ